MSELRPHVYESISGVQRQLAKEGIAKSQKNQQQGFRFRGIDDVLNALTKAMSDNGLVIIPRMLTRETMERTTGQGKPLFTVTVTVEYQLTSVHDGSSVLAVCPGEAMDTADKATNKAMSAAYKYMAIQTFCIPTEGDNDADATTHEVSAQKPHNTQKAKPPRDVVALVRSCTSLQQLQALWGEFTPEEKHAAEMYKEAKKEELS